ncbi:hypothetical protein B0H14DRAFT_2567828 [Mycena olivaceomarginata]|nr:hypothetical protein B0H14DRAFT_2567828 [Mycena olivaceomarginata]
MYDEVVQNFRHTGFQTDPTHWFENPAWEREEQDGLGGRRTRDTKCERERERMMVERKKAKIINHLSNAREVHGPLMADFEMDWSKFTIFFVLVPFYGFGCSTSNGYLVHSTTTQQPPNLRPYFKLHLNSGPSELCEAQLRCRESVHQWPLNIMAKFRKWLDVAVWRTGAPPPPDQPYPTRQPDVKHFPDAKKKQEKADKAEGAKEWGDQ